MFFVRADGNSILGLGHVMRCLSIAEALKMDGQNVHFIAADDAVAGMIMDKGFNVWILGTDYKDMEAELPAIRNLFSQMNVNHPVCLVDSYQVTKRYLEQLSLMAKVAMMDDIFLLDYPVDCVINYNIYGELLCEQPTDYPGRRLLTGVKYAPLRTQFIEKRLERAQEKNRLENHTKKQLEKQPDDKKKTLGQKHILISTGGSDSLHLAEKITKCFLAKVNQGATENIFYNCIFHVVCGAMNPNKETLLELEKENPEQVKIHIDVKDMASLMSQCDVAVTAAGSTVYELSTLGIPFVLYYFVDNQKLIAKYSMEILGVVNAGDFSKESEELILNRIMGEVDHLLTDDTYRINQSARLSSLVDGEGAKRIANELKQLSNEIE